MNSLKLDFHTVCTDYRGIDCDLETCCIDCANISDVTMSDYVSHKLSLKKKLLVKRKLKAPLLPPMVVQDPAGTVGDLSPAEPASPSASPALATSASNSVAENQAAVESSIISQLQSMFASFAVLKS